MKNHHAKALPVLAGAVPVFAVVFLVTSIWQYSRNSLVESGNWLSSKALMEVSPTGSSHFLLTRHALHRDRLQLHAWHGYNEVLLNRVFSPGSLKAEFRLGYDSWLCVLFNRTESGFDGIRLSRNSRFPSMLFHCDRKGRFEETSPLPDLSLSSAWHAVELDFTSGFLEARVDGHKLEIPRVTPVARQFVSFRCSEAPCQIDNVRVTDANGSLVIAESFRNLKGRGRVAAMTLACVAAVAALFWVIGKATKAGAKPAFAFFVALLSFLAIAAIYSCFDRFYWTRQYSYYSGYTPHGHFGSSTLSRIEALRNAIFGTNLDPESAKERVAIMEKDPFVLQAVTAWNLRERPPATMIRYTSSRGGNAPAFLDPDDVSKIPAKQAGDIRLAFIGTSQTFGEGVEVETDRFVDRIHRQSAALLDGRCEIDTFNFAIKGSTSDKLFEEYNEDWVGIAPDLAVVNLSYNDLNTEVLERSLRNFAELNRSKGIPTVFVIEPASPELTGEARLDRNRAAMRAIATESGVLVADLSAHLDSDAVRDSGFLWWDHVHLTSLGHEIAAAFLMERLGPVIETLLSAATATEGNPAK